MAPGPQAHDTRCWSAAKQAGLKWKAVSKAVLVTGGYRGLCAADAAGHDQTVSSNHLDGLSLCQVSHRDDSAPALICLTGNSENPFGALSRSVNDMNRVFTD